MADGSATVHPFYLVTFDGKEPIQRKNNVTFSSLALTQHTLPLESTPCRLRARTIVGLLALADSVAGTRGITWYCFGATGFKELGNIKVVFCYSHLQRKLSFLIFDG